MSAWNFDVAALKEQAAREGPDPPMPTISEGPAQAPPEGGPQSHPLKLPANGPNEPGQGKQYPFFKLGISCPKQATLLESMRLSVAWGSVKSACAGRSVAVGC